MFLDMQGQDAIYSCINEGKGSKMAKYELTEEEFETIQAIRKGEAGVVMLPRRTRRDSIEFPNIGDIDQDGCKIIEVDWRGGVLVSSPLEPQEIKTALANGAKRVII